MTLAVIRIKRLLDVAVDLVRETRRMKGVLESCVALKWVLAEADSSISLKLRSEFQNQFYELLTPDIFPAERASAQNRLRSPTRTLWWRGGIL